MSFFSTQNESFLRLGLFVSIFSLLGILEFIFPKRPLQESRSKRWITNMSLVALSQSIVKLLPTFLLPAGFALLTEKNSWGLLHQVSWPYFLKACIGVVFLDFVIYIQHIYFHQIPLLWRLHKVHHSDLDLDVSSGNRFHPFEIIISLIIKIGAIAFIGASAETVIIFEIILNGMSQFNHSNLRIPQKTDYILRLFLVTPDMHRVHHSRVLKETNSNYGFNLSIWDKIFCTYIAQPEKGHFDMTLGLPSKKTQSSQNLGNLLIMPFKNEDSL